MKTIIFDMDGVIVDSEKLYYDVRKKCFEKFNIPYTKQLNESFIGASPKYYDATYQRLCIENNVSYDELNKFSDELLKNFDYSAIMFQDIEELFLSLKQKGYVLGLASSSTMKEINQVMTTCKIEHFFDSILSGEMFKETKPNPEIYLTAAKNLNSNPNECIVIEDSTIGILAAKRANMYVFARKEERFECDQTLADKCFSTYKELEHMILSL